MICGPLIEKMRIVHSGVDELARNGYCVLRARFSPSLIDACRNALWPTLLAHIEGHEPNRGAHRHYFAMPFDPPCFRAATSSSTTRFCASSAARWTIESLPTNGAATFRSRGRRIRTLMSTTRDRCSPNRRIWCCRPYMSWSASGLSRIMREADAAEVASRRNLTECRAPPRCAPSKPGRFRHVSSFDWYGPWARQSRECKRHSARCLEWSDRTRNSESCAFQSPRRSHCHPEGAKRLKDRPGRRIDSA